MKEPTQGQTKEFWEWCGFTYLPYAQTSFGAKANDGCWLNPGETRQRIGQNERTWSFQLPIIDSNNLFKYTPEYQQIIFQPGYCGIIIEDKLYEGSGGTEEDALFWAWWQVKGISRSIATVAEYNYDDESRANLYLIAASPRLFEYIKGRADEGDNDAKCLLAVLGLG